MCRQFVVFLKIWCFFIFYIYLNYKLKIVKKIILKQMEVGECYIVFFLIEIIKLREISKE